jgi:RNA polymerase sigma-70 factor, ECF subfamily
MSTDDLASIVATWQPRVRGYFARRCACPDDVEDLSQETMAAIVRCYSTFSHRSELSTWIYAICRNVFSGFLYHRARDVRLIGKLRSEPPAEERSPPAALPDALGRLTGEEKRLYTLYYVEGSSVREVAARLGRPEGTVKYLLHELRRRVRLLLAEDG